MNNTIYQVLQSCSNSEQPQFNNLVDMLQYRGDSNNSDIACILLEDGFTEKEIKTFGEIDLHARAVGASLQKIGQKGDPVLLLFPTGIDFIIGLFGCFYAGMVAIPAYPPRKNKVNERFHSILDNSGTQIILTNDSLFNNVNAYLEAKTLAEQFTVLNYQDIDSTSSKGWVDPQLEPDDLAILQYTSGSTGDPNGVMVTHANILYNCEFIFQSFSLSHDSTLVNWLPNFHDMGLIGCVIEPIYGGFKNVMIPPNIFLQNPLSWLKAISKYHGTTAGGPNFCFDYCLERIPEEEREAIDLSSLTVFWTGAETIRKSTLESFADEFKVSKFNKSQFFPCYGLAEATLIVTGGNLKDDPVYLKLNRKAIEANRIELASTDHSDTEEYVGCGFPWINTYVYIVDPETHQRCKEDVIGEIWVYGPAVAKGYWKNPQLTNTVFGAYIKGADEGPFLRTGDLGFVKNGQLFVTGRLKELIIVNGKNYYPQDIENIMHNSHEALRINAGAAFSVEWDDKERLVVINEINRTYIQNLNADEVINSIRKSIFEEYDILPFSIVLIKTGSLMKTTSGKIKRRATKDAFINDNLFKLAEWKMPILDPDFESLSSFDTTSLKVWLTDWISTNLGIEKVQIDPEIPITSFGLDSLMMVQLERDVSNTFNISFPIESFLQQNTINQLVEEGERLLQGK